VSLPYKPFKLVVVGELVTPIGCSKKEGSLGAESTCGVGSSCACEDLGLSEV
jgi:hypothetical protein